MSKFSITLIITNPFYLNNNISTTQLLSPSTVLYVIRQCCSILDGSRTFPPLVQWNENHRSIINHLDSYYIHWTLGCTFINYNIGQTHSYFHTCTVSNRQTRSCSCSKFYLSFSLYLPSQFFKIITNGSPSNGPGAKCNLRSSSASSDQDVLSCLM